MGMLDEDEALMLQKLQEKHEKNFIALEESHSRLRAEVTTLLNIIAQLQTKNQRLSSELKTTHTQLEDKATLLQTSLLQRFDEKSGKIVDLEQTMETIFQHLVDDFSDKTDLVDNLVKEVKIISLENVALKKENAGLKNQWKYAKDVFQIAMAEHSRRIVSMGNTAASFFQTLADEFEEKSDLLEDLEEEAKSLSHTTMSTYVIQLIEGNT
jgi:hypothetical protein